MDYETTAQLIAFVTAFYLMYIGIT